MMTSWANQSAITLHYEKEKRIMDKPNGYYYKGTLWGYDGYYIAIGMEDAAFFFGSLSEAKRSACANHYLSTKNVKWINMGSRKEFY